MNSDMVHFCHSNRQFHYLVSPVPRPSQACLWASYMTFEPSKEKLSSLSSKVKYAAKRMEMEKAWTQ